MHAAIFKASGSVVLFEWQTVKQKPLLDQLRAAGNFQGSWILAGAIHNKDLLVSIV